jgi:hypothetical protein
MMPTLLPACLASGYAMLYQGVGVVWRVAARRRGGKDAFPWRHDLLWENIRGPGGASKIREPSRHLHAATTVATIHNQLSAALILLTEINQTAEGKMCSYLGLFTGYPFSTPAHSLSSLLLQNTTQLGSI